MPAFALPCFGQKRPSVHPLSLSFSLCVCMSDHPYFPSCSRNKVSAQCIKQCIVIFLFFSCRMSMGEHLYVCVLFLTMHLYFSFLLPIFPLILARQNINKRTSTLSPLLEPRNTCPQQHGPAYLKRLRPNRKKKLESNFSSSQSFFLCYRFCCFVCYYYCCCCNLCLVYGICVYVCVLCLGDGW